MQGAALVKVQSGGTSRAIDGGPTGRAVITDYDGTVVDFYGSDDPTFSPGQPVTVRLPGGRTEGADVQVEGFAPLAKGSMVVVFVQTQPASSLAGGSTIPVPSPGNMATVDGDQVVWAGQTFSLSDFADRLKRNPARR